jgi:hypothetical protein
VTNTRRAVAGVALGLVALAYAWWAVGLPAFSAAATVAVLGAGAVAMFAGSRSSRPDRPRATGRVLPWLALVGLLAAIQVFAYVQEPRDEHPTLSSLTNAALDSHVARAAAFVAWLAAAVELARR